MPEKDNRKIVRGVQAPESDDGIVGTTLRTYHPGDEDALEAVLTAGQYAHLKAEGAIEGDWKPAGTPPQPMPGSRADRASHTDEKRALESAKRLDDLAKKRAEARMKDDETAERATEREQREYRRTLSQEAGKAPEKK
jgi:hypothetical protein